MMKIYQKNTRWIKSILKRKLGAFVGFCFVGPFRGKKDICRSWNRVGFTLIELLVVVLIIGVLAAVALPQYEKAVTKTRIMSGVNIGRALMTALDEYYLTNTGFTSVYDNLTLSIPAGYTDKDGNPYNKLKAGDAIYYNVGKANEAKYQISSGGKVQYQTPLPNGKSISIYFYSSYATADSGAYKGRIFCTGESNAAIATQYCKLIGGVREGTSSKYFLN